MFGRRKEPPASPPPPGGREPFPIEKMDRALDGAIRLFTRVLDKAGVDAGELAIRGPVPNGITQALADCTTYRGQDDGNLTYLVLGLTADFKEFDVSAALPLVLHHQLDRHLRGRACADHSNSSLRRTSFPDP